jgi:tRNA pseudouridine32 synthase / 23S rRNA pseudouridine746 synthase
VVLEDEHVMVVNKPAGVLSVPGKEGYPSLAQAVFDSIGDSIPLESADRMVVHRLGMDTSGLMILAKSMEAVRALNAMFRTRKVERHYEALICGHVEKDQGWIDLPLMRDYEYPPFMRISTEAHQAALADLDPEDVGSKILERPKDSLTKYQVVARETLQGQPVTRVVLTSISGRTHQLNVHLAALGHPIVGDTTYGIDGMAAPNGGLTAAELDAMVPNAARASEEVQRSLASAAQQSYVHAKSLKFRHPITKQEVVVSSDAPF